MSGSVTASGLQQVTMRFTNATQALHDRLLAAMNTEVEQVAFYARARLQELFKNPGKMMAAIETQVTDGRTFITGEVIASGLPYLAIHEYGGQTRPHDIFPVNAKALRFAGNPSIDFSGTKNSANTDIVFAKAVHHPGSKMPERSYMRYALAQRRSAIREAFLGAAAGAI